MPLSNSCGGGSGSDILRVNIITATATQPSPNECEGCHHTGRWVNESIYTQRIRVNQISSTAILLLIVIAAISEGATNAYSNAICLCVDSKQQNNDDNHNNGSVSYENCAIHTAYIRPSITIFRAH